MPTRPPTIDGRIVEIREWIASAERRGVPRADLLLHLSNRDASGLKRSPGVRTDEISFVDGKMRFLGVEVAAASSSSLDQRPPA